MPGTALRTCLTLVVLFASASVGLAGHGQHWALHWGRWWGYGWSEGYHARDEMPPRRHHSKHSRPMPWPSVSHDTPIVPPPLVKSVEALPLPLPPPVAPLELEDSR